MMLKSIIITGATGFVGTNLLAYLKDLYILQPLSVRYQLNQKENLTSEVIIHLASKAHDLKKVANPQEYYEANFELTKQLFDSFLKSKASIFIFISTVKAVADKAETIITEDIVPNPKTHYGISKMQAENYILNQPLPEGKRVYILRPCMIHGSGNKGNLNLLYQLVSKGIPWPLGAFHNQRSFCSIDNVCYVVKQILDREDIPSGVYNLADDETLSTNELIEIIGATTNKKAKIISISKKVINTIAKIGDILRLPLNTERLDKLTENFVVSNLKIKAALGIEKLPVTAKEGLVKTFQSFTK
jgi:nucleoside-diphosphate-sugar epimerase